MNWKPTRFVVKTPGIECPEWTAGGEQQVDAVDEREDAEVGGIKEKGQYVTGNRNYDQPCTDRLDQLLRKILQNKTQKLYAHY